MEGNRIGWCVGIVGRGRIFPATTTAVVVGCSRWDEWHVGKVAPYMVDELGVDDKWVDVALTGFDAA
jgi:hypothetical protein